MADGCFLDDAGEMDDSLDGWDAGGYKVLEWSGYWRFIPGIVTCGFCCFCATVTATRWNSSNRSHGSNSPNLEVKQPTNWLTLNPPFQSASQSATLSAQTLDPVLRQEERIFYQFWQRVGSLLYWRRGLVAISLSRICTKPLREKQTPGLFTDYDYMK